MCICIYFYVYICIRGLPCESFKDSNTRSPDEISILINGERRLEADDVISLHKSVGFIRVIPCKSATKVFMMAEYIYFLSNTSVVCAT